MARSGLLPLWAGWGQDKGAVLGATKGAGRGREKGRAWAPQCWGDKFECAVILIAAHMMTVASGGESGPVASKKIDKISVSYSATSFDSSDAAFSGTRYGRDYLAMRETLLVFPVVGTGLPRVWPRSFRRGRY